MSLSVVRRYLSHVKGESTSLQILVREVANVLQYYRRNELVIRIGFVFGISPGLSGSGRNQTFPMLSKPLNKWLLSWWFHRSCRSQVARLWVCQELEKGNFLCSRESGCCLTVAPLDFLR